MAGGLGAVGSAGGVGSGLGGSAADVSSPLLGGGSGGGGLSAMEAPTQVCVWGLGVEVWLSVAVCESGCVLNTKQTEQSRQTRVRSYGQIPTPCVCV